VINIKCYYCNEEACAKIGFAEGTIIAGLFPQWLCKKLKIQVWSKSERYCCRLHFNPKHRELAEKGEIIE